MKKVIIPFSILALASGAAFAANQAVDANNGSVRSLQVLQQDTNQAANNSQKAYVNQLAGYTKKAEPVVIKKPTPKKRQI